MSENEGAVTEAKAADDFVQEAQEPAATPKPDGDSPKESPESENDNEAPEGEGEGEEDGAEPKPKRRRLRGSERKAIRLEAENRVLREQLERGQQAAQPKQEAPGQEDPKPKQEEYQDYADYVADNAAWAARQESQKLFEKESKRREADTKKQAQTERQKVYGQRIAEAQERHEDFDDYAWNDEVPVTKPMADAIFDSDAGPELQYFLGKNPEEAQRIAGMTDLGQVRAIGALEARLSAQSATAAPTPRTTSAPPPIQPIAGKGKAGGRIDPDKLSMDEWAKLDKAGKLKY